MVKNMQDTHQFTQGLSWCCRAIKADYEKIQVAEAGSAGSVDDISRLIKSYRA